MERGIIGITKHVESLFKDTESIVIAAFQVFKASRSSETTGSELLKALGGKSLQRGALKPRVLVLSVKRSLTDRGFKGSLHICKELEPAKGLQVRRSYSIQCLHDILVLNKKAAGSSRALQQAADQQQQQHWVELVIASHHEVAEHRGCYLMQDQQLMTFFIALVTQILRQQDAVLPTIAGTSQDKVDAWWTSNKEYVTAQLPAFALEVITPGSLQVGRKEDTSVLISGKEEADLEELLGLFDLALGDSDTFNDRLQEEYAALEAANVYAILEGTPMVDGVMLQLKRTQGILDDLDESLKVFDFKLRHMRDDITAIEASNNTLGRQSQHNAALLSSIQNLQEGLDMDPDMAMLLERPNFDPYRLRPLVAAAWSLVDKRDWINGSGSYGDISTGFGASAAPGLRAPLNPLLRQMRVVREARQRLEGLCSRFVARTRTHLEQLITALVKYVMDDWSRQTHRMSKLLPPDRSRLRETLMSNRDLIVVLTALNPDSLTTLQQHYCQNINTLLRRELRGCSGELRRGVQVELSSSSNAGDGDYSLVKERPAGPKVQTVSRMSTGSGSQGGSEGYADLGDFGGEAGWPSQTPRSPLGRSVLAGRAAGLASKRQAFLEGVGSGLPLYEAWQHLMLAWLPFLLSETMFAARLLLMYRGDDRPQRPEAAGFNGTGGPGSPLLGLRDTPSSSALDKLQQQLTQGMAGAAGSRPSSRPASPALPGGGAAAGATGDSSSRRGRGRESAEGAAVRRSLEEKDDQPLNKGGVVAVNSTMAGLEGEFMVLIESINKSNQVQAVPVLALSRAWTYRLASRPAGAPLAAMLARCCDQLLSSFQAWINSQLAAVEAYDSKSKMGLQQGIRNVHVLPYISQFCLLAHDLELLLAQVAFTGNSEEEGEEDAAQQEAVRSVRADVDQVYSRLVSTIFSRLERAAASDLKYEQRLRLENYTYFSSALAGLAGRAPVLAEAVQTAESRREAALSSYVLSQLEYGKLWKMIEFVDKVDKLLQVVTPPEVAFQKDCSAGEVRSLVKATMDSADKKLEAMAQRVRKHLGQGALSVSVWARLREELMAKYEHLEELMEVCYPTTPLRPSPEELRELFKTTSLGG